MHGLGGGRYVALTRSSVCISVALLQHIASTKQCLLTRDLEASSIIHVNLVRLRHSGTEGALEPLFETHSGTFLSGEATYLTLSRFVGFRRNVFPKVKRTPTKYFLEVPRILGNVATGIIWFWSIFGIRPNMAVVVGHVKVSIVFVDCYLVIVSGVPNYMCVILVCVCACRLASSCAACPRTCTIQQPWDNSLPLLRTSSSHVMAYTTTQYISLSMKYHTYAILVTWLLRCLVRFVNLVAWLAKCFMLLICHG